MIIVEVAEQSVGKVAKAALVQRLAVFFDDVLQDEFADVGAPGGQFAHMTAVSGQKPGQKVNGIALIDVPEDLVKETDSLLERRVRVAETGGAHVVREHVSTHSQQCRFQVDSALGFGGGQLSAEFLDHEPALGRQHVAQCVKLKRRSPRMAITASQRASSFLQVGPVAQRQS